MKFLNFCKKSLVLVAAGMTFWTAIPVLAQETTLHFGIISTESTQHSRKHWEPFLAAMEKETGYTIKPFFASDYAGIITGMQYGKVQLAWYGNKAAKEAVDRAKGEVFVQVINKDGSDGYYSHILARTDSTINSLDDMFARAKDLNFGNGDPNSTSGYLVPNYYAFAKNDKDAKKIFKRVLTAGHETNALAVANGQVHVATCGSGALDRLEKNNPEKHKLLKIIWTSPLIPRDPIVWRKDLPQDVKNALRTFFLEYGVKGEDVGFEKQVLAKLGWSHYRASSNAQLLPIRQLELFKDKNAIMQNTQLSEEEKKVKIHEIDAKLAKLATQLTSQK